jgi:cytochrome P450
MIAQLLTSPWFIRIATGFLRTFFPVLNLGSWVIVSRFDAVKEILTRDKDFTIAEINAANMHAVDLDFFLGMDTSEVHDREKGIMEAMVKREDLSLIQKIIQEEIATLLPPLLSNKKIEVVSQLSRVVPLALLERYFGVPVTDKKKMQDWMRKLFHQLFLNLNSDLQVTTSARQAATELKTYMMDVIAEAHKKMTNGNLSQDTLLCRLLHLQKSNPTITNDFIRRNICGLMIGAVDTTNKCVVLVLEELLKRPEALAAAATADPVSLKNICYEALRFNPHNPIVVRFSKNEQFVGKHRIKASKKIAVGIFSAMHDKHAFAEPGSFNWKRTNEYLHFGYGLHACFGRYINAVQIPEIVGSLVRLQNLRKSPRPEGKVVYDGPFPDSFWLEFD